MKDKIKKVLGKCERCSVMNRIKKGASDFVSVSRPFDKVTLDMIDMRAERKNILVVIDYFSRGVEAVVLPSKETSKVVSIVREWINTVPGYRFGKIITSNGKKFCNREFEEMYAREKVKHTKVSVELYKSNGRVESVIGMIREGLMKSGEDKLEDKMSRLVGAYNETYHSEIKCTLKEAWKDERGMAAWQNRPDGEYAKKFRRGYRETFKVGDKIRVAKSENLVSKL